MRRAPEICPRLTLPGKGRQLAERRDHPGTDEQGGHQDRDNHRENRAEEGASDPARLPGDVRHGTGEADVPRRGCAVAQRNGHVERLLFQGAAVTDRGALPPEARLLDFGPVEMVVELHEARFRVRDHRSPKRR